MYDMLALPRNIVTSMHRPVTRGRNSPYKFFALPWKISWTSFKTFGHSSKNLDPSQKNLRRPGVPSRLRACMSMHIVLQYFQIWKQSVMKYHKLPITTTRNVYESFHTFLTILTRNSKHSRRFCFLCENHPWQKFAFTFIFIWHDETQPSCLLWKEVRFETNFKL